MKRPSEVWRDERGIGFFAPMLVMILAFTAAACIGLLVDGGRISAARRTADQAAFQASRSAAQHLDQDALRSGAIVITDDAQTAAAETVDRLLTAAGRDGRMTDISIEGRHVTVAVVIEQPLTASVLFGNSTATIAGSGSARVGAGVTSEETPLP